MNDKLRKLIRALLVLIGIGILVYPSLSQYLHQKNSSRVIASYNDDVNKIEHSRKEAILKEAQAYNQMLASPEGKKSGFKDSDGNPIIYDSYEKMLNISGNGMIGYISIPKLNETNCIYHGTEESVLQVGVGHYKNTSLPIGGDSSHAVIMGHRGLPSADLFTDLDQLEIGDQFYIKILDRTLCYTVDSINTVLPDKMEELSIEKGRDYVTLVTCTPYGVNSHRLLVRGVRTPYDESKGIPVYQVTDIQSFWTKLPAQYRHMLIGAGVIVAFLVFWIPIRAIMAKKRKKKRKEVSPDEK